MLPSDAPKASFFGKAISAAWKTRTRGLGWLKQCLRQEFRAPTTGPSKLLRRGVIALESAAANILRLFVRVPSVVGSDHKRTLYLFYDLEVCPLTYDIASYLVLAEMERRRRGLERIHVVIVPGSRLLEEEEAYQEAVPPDARRLRLFEMVIPVLSLLPSCAGYTLCASRGHAAAVRLMLARHIFPGDYRPGFPTYPDGRNMRERARSGEPVFPMLRASAEAIRAVRGFLLPRAGGRRVIVITLREYGYMPARNSNLKSWIDFADMLDPKRYAVVFVRDTSRALEIPPADLQHHIVFETASWNVALRMALYQIAFVNLGVMHGPMELCWYNEACRYLVFVGLGTAPQTARDTLRRNGFEIGRSLPFARDYQKCVWEPDDFPVVCREFEAMERLLETEPSANGGGSDAYGSAQPS